jgi:hypothetical protein
VIERVAADYFSRSGQPKLAECVQLAQIAAKLGVTIGDSFRYACADLKLSGRSARACCSTRMARSRSLLPEPVRKTQLLHGDYVGELQILHAGGLAALGVVWAVRGFRRWRPWFRSGRAFTGGQQLTSEAQARGARQRALLSLCHQPASLSRIGTSLPTTGGIGRGWRRPTPVSGPRSSARYPGSARHLLVAGRQSPACCRWRPPDRRDRFQFGAPADRLAAEAAGQALPSRYAQHGPASGGSGAQDAGDGGVDRRRALRAWAARSGNHAPAARPSRRPQHAERSGRLLDRLRALAKSDKAPAHEVEKWYRRLDQMLDGCSTADAQNIRTAFKAEKLILAQDGTWVTVRRRLSRHGDEEDVPGAASCARRCSISACGIVSVSPIAHRRIWRCNGLGRWPRESAVGRRRPARSHPAGPLPDPYLGGVRTLAEPRGRVGAGRVRLPMA